jgi:hypothetical protein
VTAQLLYEIGGPRYLNPDVPTRFDTIALEQVGPDRVRLSGVRGEPPPPDLKVSLNYAGGYRNSMILAIEGLDVAAKAELAERTIWARVDGGKAAFETAEVELVGSDPALLRIVVLDQDQAKVGRAFSAAVIETGLASYPGFYGLTPPGGASMYGVYWPTTIPADLVGTRVLIGGEPAWTGPARTQPTTPQSTTPQPTTTQPTATQQTATQPPGGAGTGTARPPMTSPAGPTSRVPLGVIAGARSGDKGGNANVGVWVRTEAEFAWLDGYLTAERLASLVPAAAGLPVQRYRLPNLLALNFVIVGLLGRGVAASTRLDPQAKALGEEVRAAVADIPVALLPVPSGSG